MLTQQKSKELKDLVRINCQKLEDISYEIGDALSIYKLHALKEEIIKTIEKRSQVIEAKNGG